MMNEDDYMRMHVSPQFIAEVFKAFPGLSNQGPKSEGFRRLFAYLLFAPYNDEESGELLLSHKTLKKLALGWKRAAKDQNNFVSGLFLKEFQEKCVHGFQYNDYQEDKNSWSGGKCRSVKRFGINANIFGLAFEELKKTDFTGNIYFDTLLTRTKITAAGVRKTCFDEYSERLLKFDLNEDQKIIFDEISKVGNDGTLMSRQIKKNEQLIVDAIEKLEDEETRKRQYKILASVKDDSRIFYSPSGVSRTARLSTFGTSVINFKREVRKAALTGLHSLDAKSSQFAIMVVLLDCPLGKAFASNPNNNLWKYFHSQTPNAEKDIKFYKQFYKDMIYGITFGSGTESLIEGLKPVGAECLLENPMIKEILIRRDEYLALVSEHKYVTDVWGTKHFMEKSQFKDDLFGERTWVKKRWAGSLLGTRIQSIELHIMAGLCKLFSESSKYKIATWQHDGLSFNRLDPTSDLAPFLEKAQKRVAKRAELIGEKLFGEKIHTFLEHEEI